MTARPPILAIRSLGKTWGHKRVLNGLDARLEEGERLALAGPNGSGKSTAMRCIAGTITPSAGTIEIGGFPAGSLEARRLVGGALAHERAFYQRLSGLQNLRFYAAIRSNGATPPHREVASIVEELEIESFVRERVDRYSSGMSQQLAMARALLGDPGLILLDEPTRSLDEGAVKRLWAALDRRSKAALVIASHRPDDLERCSSRIDLTL
jgi:ABC-2 type transport system ATP-binding protein